MSVTNTQNSWGLVARIFHWGMLALIVVQIPLGFWMVEVYEDYAETYGDNTWVLRTSRMHHTLGFIVLLVVVLRFSWRLANSTPRLPASLINYQRWLAHGTHFILYVLLIVYPLSGWASLSAYEGEFPIFFFGWENAPRLVPQVAADDYFNYEFFAVIHRWCWRIGAVVLGLHVSGALWHQFVLHDGVLRRMWNGAELPIRQNAIKDSR